MKYGDIFKETLESLGIHGIYMDGFDAEQIFFQLDSAAGKRFEFLERSICQSYSKSLAESRSVMAEETFSQEDSGHSIPDSLSEQERENATVSGEASSHTELLDSEANCSSEQTVSFEDDMWDRSQSSDVELINKPAHKVLEMLRGKPSGKK